MFSKAFWRDAIERSLSTAAQFALGAIGGQAVDKVAGGLEVIVLAALTGAVLTLLKAVAASGVGDHTSASLLPEATTYER